MIADFAVPVAPTGWLECNGSAVSRSTYSDLFSAVSIQQSGTRSSGVAVITGLSSTANMKAGYYVGGTGITHGSTIVSVDSSTQITINNNATSSGTSTVIVTPYAQGDGSTTFTLPDMTTSGRFRRSRTSSTRVGETQSSQNLAHTHTTDSQGAHTHTVDIPAGQGSHAHSSDAIVMLSGSPVFQGGANFTATGATINAATLPAMTGTANSNGAHTHTAQSDGGSEARPLSMVVLTCIKY